MFNDHRDLIAKILILIVVAAGLVVAVHRSYYPPPVKKACVDGVSYIYKYDVYTLQVDTNNKPVACGL